MLPLLLRPLYHRYIIQDIKTPKNIIKVKYLDPAQSVSNKNIRYEGHITLYIINKNSKLTFMC